MPSGRVIAGHFAGRLALEWARLEIFSGDHGAAASRLPDWSTRLEQGAEPLRDRIMLARIGLALYGDSSTIEKTAATDGLLPIDRIELSLLRAARCHVRDERDNAVDELAEAMCLATSTGMTQRVVDERRSFGSAYSAAGARAGFASAGESVGGAPLIDPLTDRELEVLERLTTQLTYHEIGDELFVSPNTVKSHTAAIYRKLAVARRTEAVNRARELGILPV